MVTVTGKMWQDTYWSAEGAGNTIVWSDALGHNLAVWTLGVANGTVGISGMPAIIPGLLNAVPNGSQIDFLNPGGGLVGSVSFSAITIEEDPLTEKETFCSAITCTPDPTEDTPPIIEDYQNDGQVDPATGNCIGEVKVFNGNGKYCLKSGIKTSFFNCCDPSPGSWLFFTKACPPASMEVGYAVEQGRAHYIGETCITEWPIIGCVQKAKTYCVFNSKLGRVVHEQGRLQLEAFQPEGKWGTADQPNCEGFSPQTFSAIDFGKLDLSEVYPELAPGVDNNVLQQGAGDAIENFFNR